MQGALYILKCRHLQHFEAFFFIPAEGPGFDPDWASVDPTDKTVLIQVLPLLAGCVEAYFQ